MHLGEVAFMITSGPSDDEQPQVNSRDITRYKSCFTVSVVADPQGIHFMVVGGSAVTRV